MTRRPSRQTARPVTPTQSSHLLPRPVDVARDWSHALGAGAMACATMAAVDYAITLATAPGSVGFGVAVMLLCLHVTLFALAIPGCAIALGLASTAARVAVFSHSPARGRRWPGLLCRPPGSEPSRAAPWLWGIAFASIAYATASTWLNLDFAARFKEPQITALLLALLQLGLIGVLAAVAFAIAVSIRRLGDALDPVLGRADGLNPFTRVWAALVPVTALVLAALYLVVRRMPQLGPLIPWRHMLALFAGIAGVRVYAFVVARRGGVWPRGRRRRLIALGAALFVSAVLLPVTLVRIGAHPETKGVAIAASPPLATLISVVRRANDFDGDGYGSLLGGNDCGPFDPNINPLARDVPDNGIDENCNGRDFRLGQLPSYKLGERVPVPEAFQREWNFLLLTVDTLRYDHTGFGGYDRDTTPNLDALVARSVSFAFCQAPSAGTMASIPAILTSRFFHSGIALDDCQPSMVFNSWQSHQLEWCGLLDEFARVLASLNNETPHDELGSCLQDLLLDHQFDAHQRAASLKLMRDSSGQDSSAMGTSNSGNLRRQLSEQIGDCHLIRDRVDELLATFLRENGCLDDIDDQLQIEGATEIYNRVGFEVIFQQWRDANPNGEQPVCCLLVDIDRFSQKNERFGNETGDIIIAAFGGLLKSLLRIERGFDRVARFNGHSYALFLGGTTRDDGIMVAERTRQCIEATSFQVGGESFDVTTSLGLAAFAPNLEVHTFYNSLLEAVAAAKNAGRNRTCVLRGNHPEIAPTASIPVKGRVIEIGSRK